MSDRNQPIDSGFLQYVNPNTEEIMKEAHNGLTKREYAAIQMMQAMVAHKSPYIKEEMAHRAVGYADALFDELEKGGKE